MASNEKPNQEHKTSGRKPFITPAVHDKLTMAFMIGASDAEACYSAGISLDVLYRYQRKHPEFKENKHRMRQRPILMARAALVKGLENNPTLALKFLERVKKDEFSKRTELNVGGSVNAVFSWEGEQPKLTVSDDPKVLEAESAMNDALPMKQVALLDETWEELDAIRAKKQGGGAIIDAGSDGGEGGEPPTPKPDAVDLPVQNSNLLSIPPEIINFFKES